MRDSFVARVNQIAADEARVAESRIENLKNQIKEAEQIKARAQTELDMARSAMSQLGSFQPDVGGIYQCPLCWMRRDTRSDLTPIPSTEEGADLFRCTSCDAEFSFEA